MLDFYIYSKNKKQKQTIFIFNIWPLLCGIGGVPADDGIRVDVPADHLHVGAGPPRGEHGHPRQGPGLWYHHSGGPAIFNMFLPFSDT